MEKKVRAGELGQLLSFATFFSITFGVDFFHSGQFPTEANPNLRKSVFLSKIAVLDVLGCHFLVTKKDGVWGLVICKLTRLDNTKKQQCFGL